MFNALLDITYVFTFAVFDTHSFAIECTMVFTTLVLLKH